MNKKGGEESNKKRDKKSDYYLPEMKSEEIGKFKKLMVSVDESRVHILEDFGYPTEYIRMSVNENKANYCLSAYYLLAIDQNY